MGEASWEHCRLALYGGEWTPKGLFRKDWEWAGDCSITYYPPGGEVREETLSEPAHARGDNAFDRALCALTGYGWELMSVQHGLQETLGGGETVRLDNQVAWLRRPVRVGRETWEPELEL